MLRKQSFVVSRSSKPTLDRRPEDWFAPARAPGMASTGDVDDLVDAALADIDINTTAPLNGGGNLSADRTLTLSGTKAEFNTALEDGDFLFVGDITPGGSWVPMVDGNEPPGFITDGMGQLILVAGPA